MKNSKEVKKRSGKRKAISDNLFPVIGIGASAGGLDAFKKLLRAIPEDSGMAYVLVQHLDPNHESLLPDILQKVTSIPVLEITNQIKVEPNHIYVIPSNKMMVANDGVLQLTSRPSKGKRNLPIDLFFTSLAEVHHRHAIGVVLSGTATDGTLGLKSIKDHGGLTFAQDEKSATYNGMPNSAVEAGVVDFILPPEQIPSMIIELTRKGGNDRSNEASQLTEDFYRQVVSLIRIRKGADFTYYKKSTIRRRILRRMAILKRSKVEDYLKYLRETKAEQDALFQDLLIPVTAFFRDPKSFEDLKRVAFPGMVKNAKALGGIDSLRIWVAGCSTGEEAYSIAIALYEYYNGNPPSFQIFATDLNERVIAKARLGIYSAKQISKLPLPVVKTYFQKKDEGFQIIKPIRDSFVFAVHNFLKDPPFSKLDLISCRNVFIYMEPYLQKKALTTFHYALNEKGILLLGKTETVSTRSDLFSWVNKSVRLFIRKDVPGKAHRILQRSVVAHDDSLLLKPEILRTDFQKAADDIVLSKYSPVGVVVNEAMEVVHFRGSTSYFLEQSSGKPTHQLLKMAKAGLVFELRNLLHKAKKTNKTVIKSNLPFKINRVPSTIQIEVIPLPNIVEAHYLILFHENLQAPTRNLPKTKKVTKDERDLQLEHLATELAQTHEDMRSITEEQETANEELQSANEELLSSSEESQSLNEELETSKEELQSTNEELVVVNQELINLNEHVTEAKEYAEGIIATMLDPLLVLDKNLRVKTANQSYYSSFRTHANETEGSLLYELDHGLWNVPALRKMLETVLPQKSAFSDFELTQTLPNGTSRILLLNARALSRHHNIEKLILLAFKDVTERKHHEKRVQELLNRFQDLVAQAPVSICIIKRDGYQIELANDAYLKLIKRTDKEFIGKRLFEVMPELVPQGFKVLLDNVMSSGVPFSAKELEVPFVKDGVMEIGYFSFNYQPLLAENGLIEGVIAVGYEVTDQVLSKRLNETNQLLREKELEEKVQQRTVELNTVNELLKRENEEKEKRAAELGEANKLLAFENGEKQKRGAELMIANQELESFTYIASHDLQEPLRKIQTFAKRIMEKEIGNLSEGGRDYFLRMERAANRMQVLIEDLLLYSRTNTKLQEMEQIDLNGMVAEVIHDLKEQIEEKNAKVDVKTLGMAHVVPFQFRQLFQNLIGNALKFYSPDRSLLVKISTEHCDNNAYSTNNPALGINQLTRDQTYMHLIISDNGIGFEQKFHDQIFQLFQRLHGREKYTGTGIGLSIVRKITDNHQGVITARGELGKGATFDIYIPS
jgi:two-component system, chemotaxis family, CheB/CheR fusion protein